MTAGAATNGGATGGTAAPLRADVALVSRGVVRSRALAQRLIDAGAVAVVVAGRSTPLTRRSQPVFPGQALQVRASPESRFVSRGGAKLDDALVRAEVDCRGRCVLDVGMSTGGFTDCLLQRGAAQVVGIEVGHGQLDASLAADDKVTCFEKTHIRDVSARWLVERGLVPAFGMIVADLSFISILGLLPHLARLATPGATLLAMVKPQFELGPDARDSKKGAVRAGTGIDALRARSRHAAEQAGWRPEHWFACALPGSDGNQEYFLHASRQSGAGGAGP